MQLESAESCYLNLSLSRFTAELEGREKLLYVFRFISTGLLQETRRGNSLLRCNMPRYKVRGVDIDFPYEAYECQIIYMEKVIHSLQEKCNALLESPTGTGKTLCLLCATLAWRKSLGGFSNGFKDGMNWGKNSMSLQQERENIPTIIYTSRTHGQLQKVIQELKRSSYRPRMVVLGSREQMCIHNDVQLLRGKLQNNACNSLCKQRACFHHIRVSEFMKSNPELGNEPFDIEDLVNIGRNQGPCPYYVSRELLKVVDILFAPYNYLIDHGNRRSLSGIQWSNAVLIFDEAHNLENICADAASFDLPSGLLSACISEAKQCVELSISGKAVEKLDDKSLNPENFAILKALLLKLEKHIADVPIKSKELGFTRPGPYIYEFLADLKITSETAPMLMDTIDQAASLLEDVISTQIGQQSKLKSSVCKLESMKDILKIVFRDGDKSHAEYYYVHVQEAPANSGKASRTLSWWCFKPGIAMEEFTKLGIRSIIATSGTLSPLDSFALELKLEFPIRVENAHVIPSHHVWVGVVCSGPSGGSFNSSYRFRDSVEYKQELGNAIVNFSRIVPDGLLVFFPSYCFMDQCVEYWKNTGHANFLNSSTIWDRICKHKQPVIEPRQSTLFQSSVEDFKAKLSNTSASGAIFFAVCRGKVSEGLDFADHAGRAVLITGVPFALRTDPKIRLKREYLDHQVAQQKHGSKGLTGEAWYSQQAARAVNQAVGRVIRHSNDYGAIIFCDERFSSEARQSEMSFWLRPHVQYYPKFGDAIFSLAKFFREIRSAVRPILEVDHAVVYNSGNEAKAGGNKLFSYAVDSHVVMQIENNSGKARSAFTSLLGGAVPANCSDPTSAEGKHMVFAHSLDMFGSQPRFSSICRKSKDPHANNHGAANLTRESHFSDQQQKSSTCLSGSSKKPRLAKADDHRLQLTKCTAHLCDIELKKSHSSSSNMLVTSGGLGDIFSDVGKVKFTSSRSDRGDENSGSFFLMQVKGKLSTSEYNEFVGFMKALKLRTMKIIPVLESIVRLFSSPDRSDILRRFKDFVPVKYQPMYEQYIVALDTVNRGNSSFDIGSTIDPLTDLLLCKRRHLTEGVITICFYS